MKAAKWYPTVASTVALVIALTGTAAWATGHLQKVTSKRIKNGAVRTVDLHSGAVTAAKAKFPVAKQLRSTPRQPRSTGATASVGNTYQPAANFGAYDKTDPTSVLQVTWTGTAAGGFSGCNFQVRVDGQPPAGGGAEIYVPNGGSAYSVSDQGLFTGLPPGSHQVQIYAKAINPGDYPCTVGPAEAQVSQTVNVAELVQ